MTGFAGQLYGAFVKTYLGIARLIGLGVQVQDILQMPDVVGTHTENTPFLALPRFEVVFFSTRPTVLGEIVSIWRNSTKRSAKSFIVQRGRPAGGVLQTNATRKAACLPVKAGGEPDRDRSLNAAVNPLSAKRYPTRRRFPFVDDIL